MPFERWIPIFIIVFTLGLIFRLPYLAGFSGSMAAVLGFAHWWRQHALDHLRYTRRFLYTRGFPGEQLDVRLEIENQKVIPLTWLRILDPWPKAVGPADEQALVSSYIPDFGVLSLGFSLRWYERARRAYTLLLRKRGVYRIGPAQARSGDLFGIYEKSGDLEQISKVTVFPELLDQEMIRMPPDNPIGGQRSLRFLMEDPNYPSGVRDYKVEDNFRRVHWPATARTGQLQVKVYQPTSEPVMVICLNVSTYPHHWEGIYPEMFEHLLSLAATLLTEAINRGFRVGLVSNGCLVNSDQPFRIPPGRSPNQLSWLLTALAEASPVVVTPFEKFINREITKIPYGSSLLILTGVTTRELLSTLSNLKKHERRVTLFSVAKEPPEIIPGIHQIHMPFRDPAESYPGEGG